MAAGMYETIQGRADAPATSGSYAQPGERQGDITAQLARLADDVENLLELASKTRDTMTNILLPVEPQRDGYAEPAQEEVMSPIAVEVLRQRSKLKIAEAMLMDILDRQQL